MLPFIILYDSSWVLFFQSCMIVMNKIVKNDSSFTLQCYAQLDIIKQMHKLLLKRSQTKMPLNGCVIDLSSNSLLDLSSKIEEAKRQIVK